MSDKNIDRTELADHLHQMAQEAADLAETLKNDGISSKLEWDAWEALNKGADWLQAAAIWLLRHEEHLRRCSSPAREPQSMSTASGTTPGSRH